MIGSGSIFPAFEPDRQGHTWARLVREFRLNLAFQLLRTRVYSFQHIRLLTFELLVAFQIAFSKLNGELQVSTMETSIRLNCPVSNTKNTFERWHVARVKARR